MSNVVPTQETQKQRPPLHDQLCDDVCFEILRFVGTGRDSLMLSLTCSTWNTLVDQSMAFGELLERDYPYRHHLVQLAVAAHGYGGNSDDNCCRRSSPTDSLRVTNWRKYCRGIQTEQETPPNKNALFFLDSTVFFGFAALKENHANNQTFEKESKMTGHDGELSTLTSWCVAKWGEGKKALRCRWNHNQLSVLLTGMPLAGITTLLLKLHSRCLATTSTEQRTQKTPTTWTETCKQLAFHGFSFVLPFPIRSSSCNFESNNASPSSSWWSQRQHFERLTMNNSMYSALMSSSHKDNIGPRYSKLVFHSIGLPYYSATRAPKMVERLLDEGTSISAESMLIYVVDAVQILDRTDADFVQMAKMELWCLLSQVCVQKNIKATPTRKSSCSCVLHLVVIAAKQDKAGSATCDRVAELLDLGRLSTSGSIGSYSGEPYLTHGASPENSMDGPPWTPTVPVVWAVVGSNVSSHQDALLWSVQWKENFKINENKTAPR